MLATDVVVVAAVGGLSCAYALDLSRVGHRNAFHNRRRQRQYRTRKTCCLKARRFSPPRKQLAQYLAAHPKLLKEYTKWKEEEEGEGDGESFPDQMRLYVFMTKYKHWRFDLAGKVVWPERNADLVEEEVRCELLEDPSARRK